MVEDALKAVSPHFALLGSPTGRRSIPPEQLLLVAVYSVRTERQLMEHLDYNLLFRWFAGLLMNDPIWDPTLFTKNRERQLQGEIAQVFFVAVLTHTCQENLLSSEHFIMDGTLLETWASGKSFKLKEASPRPPDRSLRR